MLKQKICGYCQLIAMFKVIYLTDRFLYGKKAVGFPWWHFRYKMPGIQSLITGLNKICKKILFFMSFLINSYIRESQRISKRFFDD